jgi:hypothetical protein
MIRVDVGTLVFNHSTVSPDGSGTYWYVDVIEGWDSSTVRQTMIQPTGQNYEVLAESLKGQRPLLVKGLVKATSEANFWAAWNAMEAATDSLVTANGDFKVYEGATTRKVVVRRAGQARMRIVGVCAFEFEIPLVSPDPAKTVV